MSRRLAQSPEERPMQGQKIFGSVIEFWGFHHFLNKHQPPQPWHEGLASLLGEISGWDRALEFSTHILAQSPGQILRVLSLMAISFLCFSKSWDNMDVRARNPTLTNEQSCKPSLLGNFLAPSGLPSSPKAPVSSTPASVENHCFRETVQGWRGLS